MDIRIQRSVVSNLRQRPQAIEAGPFVLGWDPTTDSRFVNYATPLPGATCTDVDVAALVAAFRDVGRIPRLEYVVSTAPDLENRLLAAGFTIEARHDYLVCSPDGYAETTPPTGFEVTAPVTDADYRGMLTAQSEAFGGLAEADDASIERARRNVRLGGIVQLAHDLTDGQVVGGAQASAPNEGLTEVAGIAVRQAFRRRGLAQALTAAVTREAFAGGAEGTWLEASGADSWRVYERVGYRPTGKRLYIALEN